MSFDITRSKAVDLEKFEKEQGFGEELEFDELLPEKQNIVWEGADVLDFGIDIATGNIQYLIET